MRGTLRALPVALVLLLSAGAANATAQPTTLTANPRVVHAGDLITVTGDACPSSQVTHVLQQTLGPNFAKGVPPFVPLDPQAVDLSETAQGVSFEVTAATPRTTLSFRVDCGDGTSAITASPVTVQPPAGELWWTYNAIDQFVAAPGNQLWFTARTWECPAGSAAAGLIATSTEAVVVGPLSTTVGSDGVIEFDIVLPASTQPGTYTGTISCNGPAGTLTNSVQILVVGTGAEMPAVGGPSAVLAWLAACLIVIGLVLRVRSQASR